MAEQNAYSTAFWTCRVTTSNSAISSSYRCNVHGYAARYTPISLRSIAHHATPK
jgi:hypothetical protein